MQAEYKCVFTNNGKEITSVNFSTDEDPYASTWALEDFIRTIFNRYMSQVTYSYEDKVADINVRIEKVVND